MILPLTRSNLHGVWHAILTPWTEKNDFDALRFRQEIRRFADCGLQGMYTGGTTGEFYAQDEALFERITTIACEEVHALNLPVQIGCTALSTRLARQRVKTACRHGANGVQIALPFWLELSNEEALNFLMDIADAAGDVPLILYQTSRAKHRLSPSELNAAALRIPTLIGTKDTACKMEDLIAMTSLTDLAIFGGDLDLTQRMNAGSRGCYSAVTALNPRLMVMLYDLTASGQLDKAQLLQSIVARFISEQLLPLHHVKGLQDAALDRLMCALGGGHAGLRCQLPYRSAEPADLEHLRTWCQSHAPELLELDPVELTRRL